MIVRCRHDKTRPRGYALSTLSARVKFACEGELELSCFNPKVIAFGPRSDSL